MALSGFGQPLANQPGLEERHKAVDVLTPGYHFVDAPMGCQVSGDPVRVA